MLMVTIVAVVVAFFQVCSLAASPKRLPNIEFLGIGYNSVIGSPHSDLIDPGFTDAVLQMEFKDQLLSPDEKWVIPDKVQVLEATGCSYESETSEITGASSYQNLLTVDAKVNAGALAFQFSASSDFAEVSQGTGAKRSTYVTSVGTCVLYQASFRRFAPIRVTDYFAYAVNNLPLERDDATFVEFISNFGTHFASTVEMGAKTVMRYEFDQVAWTTLSQTNFDFAASASFGFSVFTGGISISTAALNAAYQMFESKKTSLKMSFIGTKPSSDGKSDTWALSAGKSPYPVSYVLRPITELFSQFYFPSSNKSELVKKAQLLSDTLMIYCQSVPGCVTPSVDPVPVLMNVVNTTFIGHTTVSCRPGFGLLSCGIKNYKTEWRFIFAAILSKPLSDLRRFSLPHTNSSCSCNDAFGAVCVVACSNSGRGFESVASVTTSGIFRVDCPSGKKVLGCNIVATRFSANFDFWRHRHHYPTDDGHGCICYDPHGAECHATCASNIRNYEVRSLYGKGNVVATCSSNNFVLGCGSKPAHGSAEPWRAYYVASLNSCVCHDDDGITCYAICGQFS